MYPKRKTVLPDDDITIISADPMFRDLRNQDQVGLSRLSQVLRRVDIFGFWMDLSEILARPGTRPMASCVAGLIMLIVFD